jgi:DNA-binding CsgD family transcriptional regulator
VKPRGPAIIDFVEAAYDLQIGDDRWLPGVVRSAEPLLRSRLGVLALTLRRPPEPGPVVIDQVDIVMGPPDIVARLAGTWGEFDMKRLWALTRPGLPKTLSEVTADHDPSAFKELMRLFDFARDGLGLIASEPDGCEVCLILPLDRVVSLSTSAREQWHMLAAHFGAGYRLRRAIRSRLARSPSHLPYGAEAVIDATNFRVAEAEGPAKSPGALAALREAAVHVDQARGELRASDPQEALELWRALVRGRWSIIDWFDSDGRRFVLGVPNAREVRDPRGLTEREYQVVSYALDGETNKLIGYHLGLSKGRVSTLLRSAMRKLGVQNRFELLNKLGDLDVGDDEL